MRALLIGAVEGTQVALRAIAGASQWTLVAVATLPPELASRHSDFVDLGPEAEALGAAVIRVERTNGDDFLQAVRALAPDIVFVIGWSQLLGDAIRHAVNDRVVGYHPAALPRLRGRAAIPWTILLDEKITASTLFWIDDQVDSGPIIGQRFFHVAPDETAASLYSKHMQALRRLLEDALPRLAANDVAVEIQDERLATWAARRRPADGRIDWHRPAAEVDRLIRAVGRPYPGAFTHAGGQLLTIWGAERWPEGARHHASAGQVIWRNDDAFAVSCGDGQAIRVFDYTCEKPHLPAMAAVLE